MKKYSFGEITAVLVGSGAGLGEHERLFFCLTQFTCRAVTVKAAFNSPPALGASSHDMTGKVCSTCQLDAIIFMSCLNYDLTANVNFGNSALCKNVRSVQIYTGPHTLSM